MAITGPCTIKLNIWWGTKTVPGTDLPLSLPVSFAGSHTHTHTHTHKHGLSTVYCHNTLGPRSLIPQTLSWHAKAVYSAKRASFNSFVTSEILSATIMHFGRLRLLAASIWLPQIRQWREWTSEEEVLHQISETNQSKLITIKKEMPLLLFLLLLSDWREIFLGWK